jgi:hypothetical protein
MIAQLAPRGASHGLEREDRPHEKGNDQCGWQEASDEGWRPHVYFRHKT